MKRIGLVTLLATAGLLALPGGALAKCELQERIALPVTMVGMEAIAPAKINGVDASLAIDTGAFFSTLSPAAAARLGLRLEALPPWLSVGGLTGAAQFHLTHVRSFALAGADAGASDFLVGEHGSGPSDGVIGQNVLGGYDEEFDLANGAVRLFQPKGCSDAALAYWAPSSFGMLPIEPVTPPQNAIRGQATLNGVEIRVAFDSGATRSVLTLRAAQRAGVRVDGPGVTASGVMVAAGRRLARVWTAPFDSFEIGGEQVKNTRVQVADVESDADMILGADFFLSHRIYIARSQDRIYFTYNGGLVFNLEQASAGAPPPAAPPRASGAGVDQASAEAASDEPTTAAGFALRAAASESRREYAQAIADYGRAIALEPNDPKHYFDRAVAHALNRQPVLSIDDLDQALKLKGDDAPALILRAELRINGGDIDGGRADLDAAIAVDPNLRRRAGQVYANAGLFQDAVDNYDKWIASHPKNEDAAGAYGARCFARALWGRDFDKALADCNQALDLVPGTPTALVGRGLVRLRRGEYDKAIADEDAVIKLQPKSPWALYGRGLAKLKKGQTADGQADLAAAAALAPQLAARAKADGLAPES
jgi:tetratricopeptide (TPR) repeat protein/predicted aspartyl protease